MHIAAQRGMRGQQSGQEKSDCCVHSGIVAAERTMVNFNLQSSSGLGFDRAGNGTPGLPY
jgi:hypothetical protein